MVAISGLNHITLAVSDIDRSYSFYTDTLGFKPEARWKQGAYLSAERLWLCLSVDDVKPAEDYSHLAFSIGQNDLDAWISKLNITNVSYWKKNTSEGDSVYFLDPDGHKLELHVGDLASRLLSIGNNPYENLKIFHQQDP